MRSDALTLHRLFSVQGDKVVATALNRLTRTVFQVYDRALSSGNTTTLFMLTLVSVKSTLSMAKTPSDVLAVHLLLKEAGL
ncbi:hypothetical protein ABKW02_23710, partial [Enterobacter cloacae]